MNKFYFTPEAKIVLFKTEEILAPSGENSPILNFKGEDVPGEPAKEFGKLEIF